MRTPTSGPTTAPAIHALFPEEPSFSRSLSDVPVAVAEGDAVEESDVIREDDVVECSADDEAVTL